MIRKFFQYKKFREYFAWDFENRFALLGTVFLGAVTYFFRVYEDFENYIDMITSILGVIIGALIGALALIFSGIVFWGSLFDKKFSESLIKYTKDEMVIDRLYTSYLFLNFNILGNIVLSFVLMFVINSSVDKVSLVPFFIIEALYVYWFLFILGYIVSIMRRGIELIQLRDEADIKGNKKTIYEIANELRIDILFEFLYRDVPTEEAYKNLKRIINNRIDMLDKTKEEKEELKKYIEEFYSLEEEN